MRIFVLEDDEAIGIGLSYTLESEKYEVTLVKTVAETKKTVENEEFDLYILDLTLPDGNGYEVCSLIKSKGDLPVIFLTAYDDEINVVTGFELGADDYISKPFRVRELLGESEKRASTILKGQRRRNCKNRRTVREYRRGEGTASWRGGNFDRYGIQIAFIVCE